MTDATDGGADGIAVAVSQDDVSVRKQVERYRNDAIAVTVHIESARAKSCEIELTDQLPAPYQDKAVEFHPRYDPQNWTQDGGLLIYRATIDPGAERRTMYGIQVGDHLKLEEFAVEPTLQVSDGDDFFEYWTEGESVQQNETPGSSEAGDRANGAAGRAHQETPEPPTEPPEGPVQALVDELQRRDLGEEERETLLEAVGIEEVAQPSERIEALRDELERVRAEVADTDREKDADGADLSSIESQLAELDERVQSLSSEVEQLKRKVEAGDRWRAAVERVVSDISED